MSETRELRVSAAAYDRFAAAAAAAGVSVRAYLERIAEGLPHELPGSGARGTAAGPEPDRRLVVLGIRDR